MSVLKSKLWTFQRAIQHLSIEWISQKWSIILIFFVHKHSNDSKSHDGPKCRLCESHACDLLHIHSRFHIGSPQLPVHQEFWCFQFHVKFECLKVICRLFQLYMTRYDVLKWAIVIHKGYPQFYNMLLYYV